MQANNLTQRVQQMGTTATLGAFEISTFEDTAHMRRPRRFQAIISCMLVHANEKARQLFSPSDRNYEQYKFKDFNHLLQHVSTALEQFVTAHKDETGLDHMRAMHSMMQMPEQFAAIMRLVEIDKFEGLTEEMIAILQAYNVKYKDF